MKKENTGVQTNTALGALPAGAKFQSAKGYRNSNGHSMEFTYTLGSSTIRTIIQPQGGHRA